MLWLDRRARAAKAKQADYADWQAAHPEWVAKLSPADIDRLLREITRGEVVLPGDKDYATARALSNPAFNYFPQCIVYCMDEREVGVCLAVARSSGAATVARSGGHSTAGFSGNADLVIDLSRMSSASVDLAAMTVTAEPGCNFRTLNQVMEAQNVHTPGGACPDVCVAGYMQGGGYGFTARIFGMNCDQAVSLRVMLTDGRVVIADRVQNRDLFWAMRGGTGSNFGILLAVTYRVYPGAMFCGFSVRWNLSTAQGQADAAAALAWLQQNFMRKGSPDAMGYQIIWAFEGPSSAANTPWVLMRGMYRGTIAQMQAALQPVLALPGAELQDLHGPEYYSVMNMLLLSTPYDVPEFPPPYDVTPPAERKVSRYVADPIPVSGWLRLIRYFLSTPSPYTIVAMEIYGAAIAKVPMDDCAFIHRAVDFDVFFDVFWLNEAEKPKMVAYLEGWQAAIAPFWSGQVYQNYPSLDDGNFAQEYWLNRYALLQMVKAKYDPGLVLRYAQSVQPLKDAARLDDLPGLRDAVVEAVAG